MNKYLNDAININEKLLKHYHYLHQNPEIGFNLDKTYEYVYNELKKLNLSPVSCGKKGLFVDIGNGKNIVLIRADMDALPITEDTKLSYKSSNENMHACGHDIHTSMLLGTAEVLSKCKFDGKIRLMFQPAEEILEGAKDMIANNVLEDVKCAFMLHVMPNTQLETGTLIVPPSGIITPFCDNFTITLNGKSTHGGMPHLGIDLFSVSSLIILSLQNIKSRELNLSEKVVLSIGKISGGDTYNVIPDTLIIKGMIRSYSEDIRDFVKSRVEQIINGICISYNVKYIFKIDQSVVAFDNVKNLRTLTLEIIKNNDIYYNIVKQDNELSGGSEDFAEVSKIIPTNLFMLCAGKKDDGYEYNIHHPKTIFDPDVLKYGVAINVTLGIELSKKYK